MFGLIEFAMGKPSGKKKKQARAKTSDTNAKRNRSVEVKNIAFDEDMGIFINMAQELKEEGNKLFQKRDLQGALLNYDKALKLLPKNHADVPYLHTNMATCFMQMGPGEYHRAIAACNLALEVSPKYSKALLKRARCYESLNRFELAFQDVGAILSAEPNNVMAQEIAERMKKELEDNSVEEEENLTDPECVASPYDSPQFKPLKSKIKKKKNGKSDAKISKERTNVKEQPMKNVKLVMGEDIRRAQIPSNCSIVELREIVRNRFPRLEGVLIKYKDSEGDLVTITATEELRWAETSAEPQGSIRLYVTEVSPHQEPLFFEAKQNGISGSRGMRWREESEPVCIEDWIVQFARLFKNHVGFETVTCLDLHKLGMKFNVEAMEETVTSEEAQELFEVAAEKFQEMTALALFNWGNVHMSRARKRVFLTEDGSRESVLAQVKTAYEWAESEYVKAGEKYRESVKFNPHFYEGHLALGQQQFELAKLSWYNAVGNKVNLETWHSEGLLDLFDSVQQSITEGTKIWMKSKDKHKELSKLDKGKMLLQKMGLDELFEDISPEEVEEMHACIHSQINLLMGTVLYERSAIEYKLGIQFWDETLNMALENFQAAGASKIDTDFMKKNHCSETAHKGLGYDIDEIAQAWSEMYDVKRWMSGIPSFRLEPLLRRRIPKLHLILEDD